MKKIIMLAAVIVTVCLTNLQAQKSAPVTAAVAESFSNEFKNATNVRWIKVGASLFQSRFYYKQEYCLAYFDAEGQMILSGRKIAFDITPVAVKKATEKIRSNSEKNHELLDITEVYELNDTEGTRYFINLESESRSMSIMAYGNGTSQILKKVNHKSMEQSNPVLITRQH